MFSWTKSHQLKQRGVINVPRWYAWGFTVELWLKAGPNQCCAANHRHNSSHLFYLDCWFPLQTNSIICNQRIINICKLLMGQMVCWCGILGQQWKKKKKSKEPCRHEHMRLNEVMNRYVQRQTCGRRDCASGRYTEGEGGRRRTSRNALQHPATFGAKLIKPEQLWPVCSIQTRGVIKAISILLQDLHMLTDLYQFHSSAARP